MTDFWHPTAITAYAYLRGRPRPTNDSWIAACCLAYDLPLATRNVKDFDDFAEHEGLRILGSWFLAVSSGFGDQVCVVPAWRVDEGVMVSLAA